VLGIVSYATQHNYEIMTRPIPSKERKIPDYIQRKHLVIIGVVIIVIVILYFFMHTEMSTILFDGDLELYQGESAFFPQHVIMVSVAL
jgi:hypothetical protein